MRVALLCGIDIGGTKCAVSFGAVTEHDITVLDKQTFPTPESPELSIQAFIEVIDAFVEQMGNRQKLEGIGISCGSPLDSQEGLILSPPNLAHWQHIDVFAPFRKKYGVPLGLQNDANACALAEWKWGAGRGTRNMIFLTFGTGMGAGLILDGKLYSGTSDFAGEIGHVRMADDGPIGFGKAGSFEGFCSGGGIAQLGRTIANRLLAEGHPPSFCPTKEHLEQISAKSIGLAAQTGDPVALDIYQIVARKLGQGLAILIDVLNPEKIVIGSIFGRQQAILEPVIMEVLRHEALPRALNVCDIVPAGLGERVGDYASLTVAHVAAGRSGAHPTGA